MQEWIRKAGWFYDKCVQNPGSDYGCFPLYSIAGLVLLCILAVAMVLIVRRSYAGWKEEAKNRSALLARQDVAAPEVMEQFKWKGDAQEATELSHEELVNRIKAGKTEVRSHIDESMYVRCPDCRELIRPDAKVCKHCGYRFVPQ
jgi:hypothetical protein